MTKTTIILSQIAHSKRSKSFRTSAALILTTFVLLVAAATPVASAQTYTDLYNFATRDGTYSFVLAQGRDGNLYGTNRTASGNMGNVFEVTPNGKLKVLYKFDGVHGKYPWHGLTLGTDGNFYGTTIYGGAMGYGTIFKITPSGNLTTLYSFKDGEDGGYPAAPPIQGVDGNFYGTTTDTSSYSAYKITSSGSFTALGSIPGLSYDSLLQGTDGNFYGTTVDGGSFGEGTVFKMTPKGVVRVVHNFDGTLGNPSSPVVQGSDGNFYGTTDPGFHNNDLGVVFKLTPKGAITVLHNFPDPNYPDDGVIPLAGLVQATDGNFYGVTVYGGTANIGVIFQITPAGAYSILYNFDGAHGGKPVLTPIQHTNGKIYGVTEDGGTHAGGVFYGFDMGLAPFVSLVSTTGKVGKTIELLGQGFTSTTAVSLNGTAATFKVVSDTFLKATVPSGATTGFVTVTTPGGTLTSNKPFTVKP